MIAANARLGNLTKERCVHPSPEPRAPSSELLIKITTLVKRRFIVHYGQQPADAADLAQEVMLKLLSKLVRSKERYHNMTGLALSLTRDVWYAAARRYCRDPVAGQQDQGFLDVVDWRARPSEALSDEAVLRELAPHLRPEAVDLARCVLCYGFSMASAAARLNVSLRTAYSLRQDVVRVLQNRTRS